MWKQNRGEEAREEEEEDRRGVAAAMRRKRRRRVFFFSARRRTLHAISSSVLCFSLSLFLFEALRSGCHDALAASSLAATTEGDRARERASEGKKSKKELMPCRRRAGNKKKTSNSRQRLGKDARPVPGHHVEQATQQAVEGLEEVERRHFMFCFGEGKAEANALFFFFGDPRETELSSFPFR